VEGLIFVHNSLVGFDLRNDIRIFASGKITTGFDIIKRLAMGADLCYSARGMMMALGCIRHSNVTPTLARLESQPRTLD